ncbi:MAG: class I SAM-dependent methyltransferase [Ignavibacteriae bacterium]|nr:class I SAM-dependent methyltransferase [Ignavibacteriota bacterium]
MNAALQCSICGNVAGNVLYKAKETMFGTGELFDYFQCSKCHCLQLREIPEDLSRYYQSDYYSLANNPSKENIVLGFLRSFRSDQALKKTFIGSYLLSRFPNKALEALTRMPVEKTTRILDVGCGTGSLIYRLGEIGFTNVEGIDPFIASDIHYENGVVIHKQELAQLTSSWDIIMLFDSFEHMPTPANVLQKIFSLLSPRGICVITIPTVSSYAWEYYKTDWIQLDAPRHFFLHSIESLRLLARQTGFHIRQIVYDSNDFQFWGSEQLQQRIALFSELSYAQNPKKSSYNRRQIMQLRKKADQLNRENRGDHLAIYLEKR